MPRSRLDTYRQAFLLAEPGLGRDCFGVVICNNLSVPIHAPRSNVSPIDDFSTSSLWKLLVLKSSVALVAGLRWVARTGVVEKTPGMGGNAEEDLLCREAVGHDIDDTRRS